MTSIRAVIWTAQTMTLLIVQCSRGFGRNGLLSLCYIVKGNTPKGISWICCAGVTSSNCTVSDTPTSDHQHVSFKVNSPLLTTISARTIAFKNIRNTDLPTLFCSTEHLTTPDHLAPPPDRRLFPLCSLVYTRTMSAQSWGPPPWASLKENWTGHLP